MSIKEKQVVEWDIPPELLKSPSLVYLGQNLLLHDCLHRCHLRWMPRGWLSFWKFQVVSIHTYIIFVNDQTYIRSRDQYEFVVFSDLDERVLPARANIRFGASWHHDRYHGSWYMASRYISGFMIHDITFDFQLGEVGQRSWWWRDLVFWSSCHLLSQQLEGLPLFLDWHLGLDLEIWTSLVKFILKLRPAWKGWGCCTKAGRGL